MVCKEVVAKNLRKLKFCNWFLEYSKKKTLSALEIMLTSAVQAGDTVIYLSIRQVALLAQFRFKRL